MMLGVLAKLPSGYLLAIFVVLLLNKDIDINRKMIFIAVSIISIIPV